MSDEPPKWLERAAFGFVVSIAVAIAVAIVALGGIVVHDVFVVKGHWPLLVVAVAVFVWCWGIGWAFDRLPQQLRKWFG